MIAETSPAVRGTGPAHVPKRPIPGAPSPPPRTLRRRFARWLFIKAYWGELDAIGKQCRQMKPNPPAVLGTLNTLRRLDLLVDD